jgi:hypothetical protein
MFGCWGKANTLIDTATRAIALMMEAASTSETSVNYQTTRRDNPEDSLSSNSPP